MTGSTPVAAIVAIATGVGVVAAQSQPPTFGTTTRTVAV